MELIELKKILTDWYMNTDIIFEIIKVNKNRETAFISTQRRNTHRFLKCNAIKYLYKNMNAFDFYDGLNLYNMYHSVAKIPNLPMMSFSWKRKQIEQEQFLAVIDDNITEYDLFFDLDDENINYVYKSTKILKQIFDNYNIPYHIKFSGTKGFHIVVGYNDLPQKIKSLPFKKIITLFKVFAYELKITQKIPCIDLRIFDLRRLCKTPYSLVFPSLNIALPLTDEQFNNFSLDIVKYDYWKTKKQQINRRGLLTRKGDPENLFELMKDIAFLRQGNKNLFDLMKLDKITLLEVMYENKLL